MKTTAKRVFHICSIACALPFLLPLLPVAAIMWLCWAITDEKEPGQEKEGMAHETDSKISSGSERLRANNTLQTKYTRFREIGSD
ncbi:MAG: hypothetical protein WD049_01295 [Candidatus Paceibacterota bacterium]